MNDKAQTQTSAPITVTYGEATFDLTKLPQASIVAMFKRGLAHYLGNELSSKVSTAKAKAEKPGEDGKPGTPLTEEQVAEVKARLFKEGVAAILAGDVGSGASRGPSKDPLEAAKEYFTRISVIATLKAHGLKVPKGEETIELADGQTRTMAQMMAARYAAQQKQIDADAAKKVKEDAARAAAAKARAAEVKSAGPVTAADLGL